MHKLTLLLMRHGKSSWDDLGVSDHDRKLTKRGKGDAKRMGQWLCDKGLEPDLVYCSSAKRAVSTARRVAKRCDCLDALDIAPALYNDGVYGVLEILARTPGTAQRVMLVGHNPTLEEIVARLANKYVAMRTATVAAIEFDQDSWDVIAHQALRGTLRYCISPRDLRD